MLSPGNDSGLEVTTFDTSYYYTPYVSGQSGPTSFLLADLDVIARTELGPRVGPQPRDRGVLVLPLLGELSEPVERRRFGRRGVNGLEILGDFRPVLAASVGERLAQQVTLTRLDHGLRPERRHRVGQAPEAATDQHEHLLTLRF